MNGIGQEEEPASSEINRRANCSVPCTGLADLVRALSFGNAYRDSLAKLLGYERTPRQFEDDSGNRSLPGAGVEESPEPAPTKLTRVVFQPKRQSFLRPDSFRLIHETESIQSESREKRLPAIAKESERSDSATLASFETLAPMSDLLSRLRRLTELSRPGSQLDLRQIVDDISRGKFRQSLPRLPKRGLGGGLHLVQDTSERLAPYGIDQGLLSRELKDLLPATSLTISTVREEKLRPHVHWPPNLSGPLDSPAPDSVVLVLGDLGALSSEPENLIDAWRSYGQRLVRRQVRRIALVPCSADWIPAELARLWTILPWDNSLRDSGIQDKTNLDKLATRLLAMLSFAVTIEPKLLRLVRSAIDDLRGFPELEAMVWQHGDLQGSDRCGISIKRSRRDILNSVRGEQPISEQLHSVRLAMAEHSRNYVGLRMAEFLNIGPEFCSTEKINEAVEWFEAINHDDPPTDPELLKRVAFFRVVAPHTTKAARDLCPALTMNWDRYLDGATPDEALQEYVDIEQSAARLVLSADSMPRKGSPVCRIYTGKAQIGVNTFDLEHHFWNGMAPEWAADWGIDEFGLWVEWQIESESDDGDELRSGGQLAPGLQCQRLRWIPPGKFVMGSPKDETGHYQNEGPQHEVTISRGFWLFDTPCTQAVYQAVTGMNPSEFKSPDRPVKRVSWEESQQFLDRIRSRSIGVEIGLPTEAEWEYACRAGTTEATYAGSFEDGSQKQSVLNSIAWYFDNSVERGESGQRGTHPVALKEPNPWGLYDTLGNVWEWCQDTYDGNAYERGEVTDPIVESSEASAYRVIRGGSWASLARRVRAAYRSWFSPGLRRGILGFRCRVRGAEPSQRAVEQAELSRKQAWRGKGGKPERAVNGRSERSREDSSLASGVRPTESAATTDQATWIQLIDRQEASIPVPQGSVASIISDIEEVRLNRISRPEWASAIGRDEFGLWADLKVMDTESRGAANLRTLDSAAVPNVRLRWIPPGRFKMGSPANEPGRYAEYEFEPHSVVIANGFWLFDTPVTQSLWELVMGKESNASHFRGDNRPVESVSWTSCQEFCNKLGDLTRLDVALPTEAEWEYACRAGTTEATYAGSFEGRFAKTIGSEFDCLVLRQ